MANGQCNYCAMSIWCPTWAEFKCLITESRVYALNPSMNCSSFKPRGRGFKERPCHCEDCLKNQVLIDAIETEK